MSPTPGASSTTGASRTTPGPVRLRRGARLASLPLGFAGRATLGLGKRLGGTPAEQVTEEMQQRAAEQLFRVLGELKGGAMKFGQALSLFESVLPEDIAAPYREHLARLQDSAPPMPTVPGPRRAGPRARRATGGDRFAAFEPVPAAAASIGQVHRAVWARRPAGRGEGAVPGRRRGAALRPASRSAGCPR